MPMDWSVEAMPPAKFYQHCFPQVIRYMNSVTDTKSEAMGIFNDTPPRTVDHWETVHIHSSTGEWDYAKKIIKAAGFNTVILAEELGEMNGYKTFPNTFGYFDDGNLSSKSNSREPSIRLEIRRSFPSSLAKKPFVPVVENNVDPYPSNPSPILGWTQRLSRKGW